MMISYLYIIVRTRCAINVAHLTRLHNSTNQLNVYLKSQWIGELHTAAEGTLQFVVKFTY